MEIFSYHEGLKKWVEIGKVWMKKEEKMESNSPVFVPCL
jgi:hypothetical protein